MFECSEKIWFELFGIEFEFGLIPLDKRAMHKVLRENSEYETDSHIYTVWKDFIGGKSPRNYAWGLGGDQRGCWISYFEP